MLWGIQYTNTATGKTCLCEVEAHVIYVIGPHAEMALEADYHNNNARENKSPGQYRAVPLPFAGDDANVFDT